MIPPFDLTISWLPDIVQKLFCTPDEAMDHTFQMKYGLAFQPEKLSKNYGASLVSFFCTTLYLGPAN